MSKSNKNAPLAAFHPTERFSNRVEDYLRYRPRYPEAMIPYLRSEAGLAETDVIADIGSGTGFLAKLFLENGNKVYGVEPNREMREAGERFLKEYPRFVSIDGTAEQTGLNGASVDIVAAAQAFHWFDREKFFAECRRILTGKQLVLLVWNIRDDSSTPFLSAYEKLIEKYGTGYSEIRHQNLGDDEIGSFFSKGSHKHSISNVQIFDFEGLKGRLLSSSYIPKQGEPGFDRMIEELRDMFERYNRNGTIDLPNATNMYFGRIG